jgi:hypothetical protein
MVSNLWISPTVKIMAPGHSLHDAQRLAAVILIERLLICIIMGYRLPADEPGQSPAYFPVTREKCTGGPEDFCGILPAVILTGRCRFTLRAFDGLKRFPGHRRNKNIRIGE